VARSDKLGKYRSKRSKERTPEPVPPEGPLPAGNDDTFVIQEHHARRLHWDFRLEREGVLVSWAVPRGIPLDPDTNHLAVHTEDHPIEYATFAGEIPRGEYGGGRVEIWDRGTYETEKWTGREVKVVLAGSRVSGRYVLFQTDGDNWMIHRMDPRVEGWEPLPELVEPMRPVIRSRLPARQEQYGFEFDWAGTRVLAYVSGGRAVLRDAAGEEVTEAHRELRRLGPVLGSRQALLDGEVASLAGARTYVVYDVLHLDGRSTLDLPYEKRRALLDELALRGRNWQVAPWFPGDGSAVRAAAREQGLPGVIAKRLDSRYEAGAESTAWLRIPA
jgi:DNA ligase D-like protein (predicted 3'-phosphoesterase)